LLVVHFRLRGCSWNRTIRGLLPSGSPNKFGFT
jgi:hypothetical protein